MLLDTNEINNLIPQSAPFLFLNSIVDHTEHSLVATYSFPETLEIFKGHFPNDPIVPGVYLCECCLQAGAAFLALKNKNKITGKAIVTKMDKVKFKNFVRPNEEFKITVSPIEALENYILMKGSVSINDKIYMSLEFTVGIVS